MTSQDITHIIRENRWLKERGEYLQGEINAAKERIEFLTEEVRKLRFYVGEQGTNETAAADWRAGVLAQADAEEENDSALD